jgi:Fe-S-cluster containining protein
MAKNAPQTGRQGVEGLELEARRTQRLKTSELLQAGRTSLQVIAIAETGEAVADAATAAARTRQPPRSPLACQEGCAWCCHKTVGTAVPEVERIIRYLRSTLSEEQLADLQARASSLVQQRRQLQNDRWTASRLPCVFLQENRCLVYPVRPLTCRGFTSRDARACERSVRKRGRVDIPVYEPQLRIATFVLDGMRAGLGEANLFAELLELTAATLIALSNPDAFEQWRLGEPVFTTARLP